MKIIFSTYILITYGKERKKGSFLTVNSWNGKKKNEMWLLRRMGIGMYLKIILKS